MNLCSKLRWSAALLVLVTAAVIGACAAGEALELVELVDAPLDAAAHLTAAASQLRRRRDSGPPVLLTMPTHSGTLAAARCLGRHGVSVTMAGENLLAPARWSRYVTRWVRSPRVADLERFFEWLVSFGRREPGHVLYPTSDDLAWLFADRAAVLGKYYRLYQPSVETMLSLLDKRSLHEHCTELEIPTLPTAFPKTLGEILRVASHIGFPLLLKPRTQVLLLTGGKGIYVENARDLPVEYARFVGGDPFHPAASGLRPHIQEPMLQSFRPRAAEGIYSLSGFIDEAQSVSARGAVKVLQRPRRLGVGLCFEEAPVEPRALDAVVRLCRKVGYYGVFEAEFVTEDGRFHLIDFNPRFYGQMGFEVARALPLPYLAWLAALGESGRLTASLVESRKWCGGAGYIYCNRFFFNLMLSLQGASGWMSKGELERWRGWLDEKSARKLAFDSVDAPGDRLPSLAAGMRDIYLAVRHPRSFYRQMIVGP